MLTMRTAGNRVNILPVLLIFLAVAAIAVIGGLATDTSTPWYQNLARPTWQPPAWLFGPVWTTIYILLALSASIAWHRSEGEQRSGLMTLYGINGVLNLAWTFIFFQAHSPLWAGVEIIVLGITIVMIMRRVWPLSRLAAILLVPYLLWVTFASVLNWEIVSLNS